MCANGSKQVKGIDFDYLWSPVVGACALRMTLLYAAVEQLCLTILDIENCFQNTLVEPEDRVVVTLPNFYMEWFCRKYPDYIIEDSPLGKYVVQSQRGLQGDRAIGRKFYLTIKAHFVKFGLLPCPQEPVLYIY